MNGLRMQEPYKESHATLNGPGVEAQLILKMPNTRDFYDIEKCFFCNELQALLYEPVDEILFGKMYYLKDKIKDYCLSYGFFTYECEPALELVVYDYRDRIRRW